MFVGRQRELEALQEAFAQGGFQMPVIYGRRRIGKTALINRFVSSHENAIVFTAQQAASQENLVRLSEAVAKAISSTTTSQDTLLPTQTFPVFQSYYDAFFALFQASLTRRIIFAIDEYPYLAASEKGVSSILQSLIDAHKQSSKLMLILCGSSMSFMEHQVLGEKSPLYGRRTLQLKIEAFDAFDAAKLTGVTDAVRGVEFYALAGGIPLYLEQLDASKSTEWNIAHRILKTGTFLSAEPENFLLQETRSPANYNSVIGAIANGCVKPSEVSDRVKIGAPQVMQLLSTLEQLQIVKKELPLTVNKKNKGHYLLTDNLFAFNYRFATKYATAIGAGMEEAVAKHIAHEELSTYIGKVFEEVCRQWLARQMTSGKIDFLPLAIGSWWGTNPKEKREEEVDIVATGANGKLLLGECKWQNSKTGVDVLETLIKRSQLFEGGGQAQLYLFSKTGFTNSCEQRAKELGAHLVSVKEMFDE